MRALAIVAVLAGALLAGCSSNHNAATPPGPSFEDLGLQATQTTGVIRGVVVDDAIRPVAGAKVVLSGPEGRTTNTTAQGTFGFDGLAAGTYFVRVSKAGFTAAQQSADVVAGVADPQVVKVLLKTDASSLPYVTAYEFAGFIECMTPNLAACGLANDLISLAGGPENATADNSQVSYTLDKVPSWAQTEMVWQSTQAAGGQMSLMYSYMNGCNDPAGLYCNHEVSGPSPLLLTATPDDIAKIGLGDKEPDLYIRTFTAPMDPAPNYAGLTLEQGFTYYTHVFYGYQPTDGWRFSSGDPVPQPPQ